MKMFKVQCATFVLAVVLCSGCGDPPIPTGTLAGKVMKGDQPYSNPAEIAVMSMKSGFAATTPISETGEFKFPEPIPAGQYTAYLTPAALTGEAAQQATSVTIDTSVPDTYWNEASSPWTVTVAEGDNSETLLIE